MVQGHRTTAAIAKPPLHQSFATARLRAAPSPECTGKGGAPRTRAGSRPRASSWRNFILRDHDIGRTYALQMIDHGDVHREHIVITPKGPGGRKECTMLAATA